jgi:hypothetical protein
MLVARRMTTAVIGAGAGGALSFVLPTNGGELRRIRISLTAGDCSSYDWAIYSDSTATAIAAGLSKVAGATGVSPGSLSSISVDSTPAAAAAPFVCALSNRTLTVKFACTGGTGGNVLTAEMLIEPQAAQFDAVAP